MYLAQWHKSGKIHYTIRQSYADNGALKSRDLFDLGTDPSRFIVTLGGSGYYFSSEIEDAIVAAGLAVEQEQLDQLLYPFLPPKIQRIIQGFDRSQRRSAHHAIAQSASAEADAHLFDKRRFHYLRFGHSDQRHIMRVRDRVFRPLYAKSRDELEQYFMVEERRLRVHERSFYVSVIFELNRFSPDQSSHLTPLAQIDQFFIAQLCHLNDDLPFWNELKTDKGLQDYLIRYVVMYFDHDPPGRSPWQAYVEDFIRRHRTYQPPVWVRIKTEEAGRLFGMPWKELKKLDKTTLSRLYRRLALKHHPDQGGEPDLFRRLTTYYKVLTDRHRR